MLWGCIYANGNVPVNEYAFTNLLTGRAGLELVVLEPQTQSIKANKVIPCSPLTTPVNGATGVPVETVIEWEETPGSLGYIISLGTFSGGTDILQPTSIGFNSFSPAQGLPENTLIYVNIEVRDTGSTTIVCDEQQFTTGSITAIPGCTDLINPSDGSTNVPLNVTLRWNYAPRATNYAVQLGTAPGTSDVLDVNLMSNDLSYTIPFTLTDNTTYNARIIPENDIGERLGCVETTFTTIVLDDDVPSCTTLLTPANGAEGVALTPLLSWNAVPSADGYLLTIGTTPDNADILDNADLGDQTSTLVLDFLSGTTYYVTVTPYNSAGNAIGCGQTSFTTTRGCGPYVDANGTVVDFNPVITLDDSYVFCVDDSPLTLTHSGDGDEFSWLQIRETTEIEVSSERDVNITEAGEYRFELTKIIPFPDGNVLECFSTHTFSVSISEAPTITGVDIRNQGFNFRLEVFIEGSSEYEFALDNEEGPYQNSSVFNNVNISDTFVYVRDKNGCGIVSRRLQRDRGFPKYFTPNGDGINDYWQVRGVRINGETVTNIQIFDRFGKRITEINPRGMGWDGTYGGKQLLDNGFWYQASTESNVVFTGYFALRK